FLSHHIHIKISYLYSTYEVLNDDSSLFTEKRVVETQLFFIAKKYLANSARYFHLFCLFRS
ncbi:hypothetical protein ABE42_25190, partial [Bacillus thuringiensis]|nr:hypothetical protein [Bacillus thuringiensis]